MTLIVAPAGSGKTVLTREWLDSRLIPWTWLALDKGDDDVRSFWNAVARALQTHEASLGVEMLEMLAEGHTSQEAIASVLNDLTLSDAMTLVLDDYQSITDHHVHETVVAFVERLPDTLHLVITSRGDAQWPVARWRARGWLSEVRQRDLQLDDVETATLLARIAQREIDDTTANAISKRTEGWAAGIQLAALGLAASSDLAQAVNDFVGSDRAVADFFLDEVLAHLEPDQREFLLQTSLLDELTPSLCDAVTERTDSGILLRWFEQAQLFVARADTAGNCFRYHQLFAELLRYELAMTTPHLVSEIHLRASRWYADHDALEPAVEHALAAGAYEQVLTLVRSHTIALGRAGRHDLARRWLHAIPADFLSADTGRTLEYGFAVAYLGDIAEGVAWVERAEALLHDDDVITRGRIHWIYAVARAHYGDVDTAVTEMADARRVIGDVSPDDDLSRTWREYLRVLSLDDRFDEALAEIEHAQSSRVAYGNLAFNRLADLAELHARRGDGPQARNILAAAYEAWDDADRPRNPGFGVAFLADAMLCMERGEHHRAVQLLETIRSFTRGFPRNGGYVLPVDVARAELTRRTGDPTGALAQIDQIVRATTADGLSPLFSSLVAEVAVRAALDAGNTERAVASADRVRPGARRQLAFALIELARADPQAAVHALDAIDNADQLAVGAPRRAIEFEILRARCSTGDLREAHARAALMLGSRFELFDRLAEATELHPQLDKICENDSALSWVNVRDAQLPADRPVGVLVDPLTDREQQVLRLLTTHLSNQEMAGELYVSLNTLKTHLKSLYRKLGADRRSDAVARARAANLLR